MGVPYHVYWGKNISSTWYQSANHEKYENAVANNWASGKNFLGMLGGGSFIADIFYADYYNVGDDRYKELIRVLALTNAKQFGKTIVETIGKDSIDFNNSKVYNGTVAALSISASAVMTVLARTANDWGVLRSRNGAYFSLRERGERFSFLITAQPSDKIYCGASWRQKYGGDIDILLYKYDPPNAQESMEGYRRVATSASSVDNPETLTYIVPPNAPTLYKIVAYAFIPSGAQISLNAMVIKKYNNRYLFENF
jgi:hypothetical protein